jgi:hypothetical protein
MIKQALHIKQIDMLLNIIENDALFDYVKASEGYIETYTLRKFIKGILKEDGYKPFRNGTHHSQERIQLNGIRTAYLEWMENHKLQSVGGTMTTEEYNKFYNKMILNSAYGVVRMGSTHIPLYIPLNITPTMV